jgi:hypothetical protein
VAKHSCPLVPFVAKNYPHPCYPEFPNSGFLIKKTIADNNCSPPWLVALLPAILSFTANLNMPPAFQNDFKTPKENFFTKHQQFLDSEEAARIATENKIVANNSVHKNLMAMFLDGQEIFKDEDAIKKQFIFDQVLNLVSGTGTAGFRGIATDANTSLPLADVIFTIKGSDKTTTSDEEGKYSITQLAADDYEVAATKAGYQDKKFIQKVKVGTISTHDIQLVNL